MSRARTSVPKSDGLGAARPMVLSALRNARNTPLEEVERRVTMATLEQCGGVKRTAARILGISLKTLYNRLEAYAEKDRQREAEATGPMPLVEEHEIAGQPDRDKSGARRH